VKVKHGVEVAEGVLSDAGPELSPRPPPPPASIPQTHLLGLLVLALWA
jgi:hypothetical protein